MCMRAAACPSHTDDAPSAAAAAAAAAGKAVARQEKVPGRERGRAGSDEAHVHAAACPHIAAVTRQFVTANGVCERQVVTADGVCEGQVVTASGVCGAFGGDGNPEEGRDAMCVCCVNVRVCGAGNKVGRVWSGSY